MDLRDLRLDYKLKTLDSDDLTSTPFLLFEKWLQEALDDDIMEANAMALATASTDGRPSCRHVLLKYFNENGLFFFTNYSSRKSEELLINPFATAVIFWVKHQRQIIIEGAVIKTSEKESSDYFASRPKASQIAVWASKQGDVLLSREELEKKVGELKEKYREHKVPCPPFWGGFCLVPTRFEFWQGRRDRLHDRFCYEQEEENWLVKRLSP